MMEAPRVFVAESGEDEAAGALAAAVEELGISSPFVVTSIHGKLLAGALDGPQETPAPDADQGWAERLGSRAHRSGADAIVAIGGGRCIDVAKLAAARAGLVVVTVPTQLAHDGICSPVAVVPNEHGRAESIGAVTPMAVFLALDVVRGAPGRTLLAGIGDLLANPLALRDWKLAVDRGLEEPNQAARDMSWESFERVRPYLDRSPDTFVGDPAFLRDLADALITSGMAMVAAGTSRPASGAEHEISHAIDELYGGRAMHGAQVAFGCVISAALYEDENLDGLIRNLERLGLPRRPADLDLDTDDIVSVLLAAPGTRPGRFTILEDADLDAKRAEDLVRRIWGGH
jgi:glycerol-1-phosphate dehydrogenase [NAD(P)+]